MLTAKQKATAVLALLRLVHQTGITPSPRDVERISAVLAHVEDEDQDQSKVELQASAIDAMEALVAELH